MAENPILKAVKTWQSSALVHPLTCGTDPSHRILEPVERVGKVILVCPDCGYELDDIPPVVSHAGTAAALDRAKAIWKCQ